MLDTTDIPAAVEKLDRASGAVVRDVRIMYRRIQRRRNAGLELSARQRAFLDGLQATERRVGRLRARIDAVRAELN